MRGDMGHFISPSRDGATIFKGKNDHGKFEPSEI